MPLWLGHSLRQAQGRLCSSFPGRVVLAIDDYVYFRRTDATPVHSRNFQLRADIQRRDRVLENFRWHSGTNQRAQEHVAADSGEAVEMGNTHKRSSWLLAVGSWPFWTRPAIEFLI